MYVDISTWVSWTWGSFQFPLPGSLKARLRRVKVLSGPWEVPKQTVLQQRSESSFQARREGLKKLKGWPLPAVAPSPTYSGFYKSQVSLLIKTLHCGKEELKIAWSIQQNFRSQRPNYFRKKSFHYENKSISILSDCHLQFPEGSVS